MEKNHTKFLETIKKLSLEVYSNLGDGFSEDIYQKALAIELRTNKIDYLRETVIELFYKDQMVGLGEIDFFFPPQKNKFFTLEVPIIIETKYSTKLEDNHRAQLRQYLHSAKLNKTAVFKDLQYGALLNWQKKVSYDQKRITPEEEVSIEFWRFAKSSFSLLDS
tara:strand:+ start:953 stop:1444 length:492 start_codon:yes stop_codon:yes gene_type:complete